MIAIANGKLPTVMALSAVLLAVRIGVTVSESNIKELRPPAAGRSEVRILLVFDPWRSAVLRSQEINRGSGRTGTGRRSRWLSSCTRITWWSGRGDGVMSGASRWRESGNLERAVETAGGPEAFSAAVSAMLDEARGWRLAELRRRRGLTQEQVAVRMGVSVARVSQIEGGDVSTQDVLNRFVAALGGTLKLIADFGDEQLKIA